MAAAARHLAQMSESDQVSLEEFLESCRATSLLADLEDDEELPEAGDDDDVGDGDDGEDDDDDDDDEEDEYDENFDEEGFENAVGAVTGGGLGVGGGGHHHRSGVHGSRNGSGGGGGSFLLGGGGRRKAWDDELVLKRKFSALIPAFDPRPGRTNVNQTTDFVVSSPEDEDEDAGGIPASPASPQPLSRPASSKSSTPQPTLAPPPPPPPMRDDATPPPTAPCLQLSLRGPNLPGVPDVEIDLTDPDWTIFHAVQTVIQSCALGSKAEKLRRLWEPTYVIVYREGGAAAADGSVSRQHSSSEEGGATEDGTESSRRNSGNPLPQLPVLSQSQCTMDEVLQLIRQLYMIDVKAKKSAAAADKSILDSSAPALATPVPQQQQQDLAVDIFHSKKITNKLVQQIQDPLILSASAMPDWCEELTSSCPMLFPFDTRLLYFQSTAFGASRSIVWLQNQRDLVGGQELDCT